MGTNILPIIFIIPLKTGLSFGILFYFVDNYRIPIKLKFNRAGVAMKLKSGKTIVVNWDQITHIKFNEQPDAITIGLRKRYYPYSAYFSKKIGKALNNKFIQS